MNLHDASVERVYGIPIEWFREVEAACDAYFKRKGIVWNRGPMKEIMHREAVTLQQKNALDKCERRRFEQQKGKPK